MNDNPESVIPKLALMGIEANVDMTTGTPILKTESSDFDTIKSVAALEGWNIDLQDRFGEAASFRVFPMQSFNEIAAALDEQETASDDFSDLDADDEEMEAEEDEAKEANRSPRFSDKEKGKDGDLAILTDTKGHKMAANLYSMIGNESMARYPSFLRDFDSLLVKYQSAESDSSSKETEDDTDFEEAMAEIASAIELAKGKKEKSPRQLFLAELMKTISGDSGENIIRQWREGRFDKFKGSMVKVAQSLVEHSPAYKETASVDVAVEEASDFFTYKFKYKPSKREIEIDSTTGGLSYTYKDEKLSDLKGKSLGRDFSVYGLLNKINKLEGHETASDVTDDELGE